MKHPWWHSLFTQWTGSERERSKANYFGAKWHVHVDQDEYYCWICKKKFIVDNLKHEESK